MASDLTAGRQARFHACFSVDPYRDPNVSVLNRS